MYYRRRLAVAGIFVALVLAGVLAFGVGPPGGYGQLGGHRASGARSRRSIGGTGLSPPWLPPAAPGSPSYLAPGSDPRALPGPILIADKANNRLVVVDPEGHLRWVWPEPGDLAPGETFRIPDDAFFSPDGRYVIATQEDDFVVTVIDIATRKIVWRYGHPGVPGSATGYLWNPDDAMMLRNGSVISADIKNCRVIQVPFGGAAVSWQQGADRACVHDPPSRYGSPNGVFPMPDGHYLVTEINGDWVDEIDAAGHLSWSAHPPGVSYPSDSNQVGPDRYLTVDYSTPGQAVIFNKEGQALWRYAPATAPAELNHPSLAEALPNGDVLLTDDHDHRVVVVDPTTDQIVWQYGHDGVPGSQPGYLDNPDGLDPLPPSSYADRYQPR